jgi:hypothetical protein
MRRRAMARAGRGAAAGLAATAAMTVTLALARRGGLLEQMPPERVTGALLRKAQAPRSEARGAARGLWPALHFGFGALAGAGFALAARRAQRSDVPAWARGAAFGTVLWATSYAGWIPALDLMPPPHHDSPARQVALVLAHGVYGAVLGELAG